MTSYDLSPLTSKKLKTMRYLSKSVELIDTDKTKDSIRTRGGNPSSMLNNLHCDIGWKEISSVKSQNPVVACLLPALSMDFVASSLLAVGATPLITEDPSDVPKDLANCKAVLVDLGAPEAILMSFMDNFDTIDRDVPVVLAASNGGACDRRRHLAVRIVEAVNVTMISGRMGDIVAVTQAILEKDSLSSLDSASDDDNDEEICKLSSPVLHNNVKSYSESSTLPPVVRKAKMKMRLGHNNSKALSESANTCNVGDDTQATLTPTHRNSPCNASSSPRGARKCIKMKKKKGLERVPTILPIVGMKGQFRETQMCHVKVDDALEYAQRLCARTGAYVHLYEMNTVTSGEVVIENKNPQMGMGNLHSTLPCSAGIAAAILACVQQCIPVNEKIRVEHCGRALSLFYVAASEAGCKASQNETGLVSPGRLRQALIDILHSLSPQEVKRLSQLVAHSEGLKICKD